MERKHNFLLVKIRFGLSTAFARKAMFKKKWHFSWRKCRGMSTWAGPKKSEFQIRYAKVLLEAMHE
jgi:hypothetical protein